jgi:hypothetical protein
MTRRRPACLGAWLTALLASPALASGASGAEPPLNEPKSEGEIAAVEPVALPPWQWDIRALVQVDWIVHRQSSVDAVNTTNGAVLNDDRFLLRRARLRARGERHYLGGWLELDANTSNGVQVPPFEAGVVVGWPSAFAAQRSQVSAGGDLAPSAVPANPLARSNAPVSTTSPSVSIAAGLLRIPFGYEGQEPLTHRPWLERGRFSTALFGQTRDLGVNLSAAYDVAELELGINNGSPLGTSTYGVVDPERGKDWVGRLGVDWPLNANVRVEAGWSWLWGKALSPGTPATKNSITWIDDNENGLVEVVELSAAPGTPSAPSAVFRHNAVGLDARLTWSMPKVGSLQLRGEVVRGVNLDRAVEPANPVLLGRDARHLGLIVGASYELWRLFWLGVRYDLYNPDSDASSREVAVVVPADRTYRTYSTTVGVKHWAARLMVQYDIEDNALGRDAAGLPTTLLDNRLTARAEVTFP